MSNSQNDFSDSVMIALLPTTSDWCSIDLPHMTLVYAGLLKDLKPGTYNELAKDASEISTRYSAITLQVIDVELFGDDDDGKVNVLRLRPTPELLAMRKMVESWNESSFPFSPHATIGPVGTIVKNVPKSLIFDRVMVSFGSEELLFWFKPK